MIGDHGVVLVNDEGHNWKGAVSVARQRYHALVIGLYAEVKILVILRYLHEVLSHLSNVILEVIEVILKAVVVSVVINVVTIKCLFELLCFHEEETIVSSYLAVVAYKQFLVGTNLTQHVLCPVLLVE